jgi:deazaflavin-dependent oxidoreductase (nitroreductase family)
MTSTGSVDFNEFNRTLVAEFRANGGKVSGMFAAAPLVLITHRGAKSGKEYTSPLACTRDGDAVVIIASKGGAPTNPDWFHNVVANPEVTVELPGETYRATARVAKGDERARLFRAQADLLPNFDEYAAKTNREIPVVVLERVTA